jgi:RNA-directed DNA polymerase
VRLHPAKTKIVYCQDSRRRGSYAHTSFTFLGYAFRTRGARRAHGKMFTGFRAAVSPEALKKMSQQVRQWRIHTRTRHNLNELAAMITPVVAGLDELLRPVLPVADVSRPAAHQHLPDAVGR